MSPALTTFLFEVANFLILTVVLSWLLFRPVRSAIQKRRAQINEKETAADRKLKEAEQSRQEIEKRLGELDEELRRKRKTSQEQADQEAERILSEAREDVERQREALKRQLVTLEDARMDRISRIVADISGQAVRQLLQQAANSDLDRALLNEACQRLQSLTGDSLSPVIVESSRELSAEERESIQSACENRAEEIDYRQNEQMAFGLKISTSRGLIDISDSGIADFAKRSLTSELNSLAHTNHKPAQHAESR
ncbi:MAG: hypothetical protein HUJ26_02265 [Planctomycetaceae bacterium]|nr:hypothetical protein [Planctomycetaceae bacterium]